MSIFHDECRDKMTPARRSQSPLLRKRLRLCWPGRCWSAKPTGNKVPKRTIKRRATGLRANSRLTFHEVRLYKISYASVTTERVFYLNKEILFRLLKNG